MTSFDKKLSSILVNRGIIAQDRGDQAISAAAAAGKTLTQYVIDEKLAQETDIIGAISEEMSLPPIDITRVEMDREAIDLVPENIARQYEVLPVAKIGRTLTLAVANPMDIMNQDNISLVSGCHLVPVVSTDVAIRNAFSKVYGQQEAPMEEMVADMGLDEAMELAEEIDEDVDVTAEAQESESAPVVKLANLLIFEAVKAGASDIHIEPFEKKTRVRYRIDGACSEKLFPPKKMHNALVSRIKLMSHLDIAERRIPQDGKFKIKFKDREIDFRVSILPLIFGEKVVLRILDTSSSGRNLDDLGFEEKALKDFSNAIEAANGMVLVTGPTGSGKSTTLYSAIRKIINVADNITTVEDPVEYTMDGVNQCQVDVKSGLTFSEALRSILRQDPDILLVGEIRDQETAEIAVQAALTGHVVFSTLHTNDAPTTITRLVDMGIDKFLVASCVNLVSAQRLVRRLCPSCKQRYKAEVEQMRKWGLVEEEIAANPDFFKPAGCSVCGELGYKGRMPLLETLPLDEGLRDMIIKGASADAIKRKALGQGMLTLRRVGLVNAMRGVTSIEEVLSITGPDT